jgi:anaerobic magnesium-protoporphyrin IX monomethyl ester cyclase
MKNTDCLLIASYEMNFKKVENITRAFGINTPVYRNLNLRFLHYNNQPQAIFDLFKLMGYEKYNSYLPDDGEKYEIFNSAIAYLGSYLHKRGYTFDFINSYLFEKDALAEKLKNDNILSIALLTTHYGTPFPIRDLISFIKKNNSKAKIIIGGPYILGEFRTKDEKEIQSLMQSLGADFFVDSPQGELALSQIIGSLKNGRHFDHINNIRYKEDGKYIATKIVPEDNKLEDNSVDWSLFSDVLPKQIFLRTALSCPFDCAFCEFHSRMGKYQYVDVPVIEKELDTIESIGKVTSVNFVDDTFNVPTGRFKEILRMMIRKRYSFKWSCLFRCQFADREMVELMAESKCEAVHLGIESGNPSVLKNMNKKATIDQFERGVALLNEFNIPTIASFIIGFPGETKESVGETIEFIDRIKPTFYMLHPWYCSRLTPIWNDREKYDLTSHQWGFNWKHATMDSSQAIDLIEYMLSQIKNSIPNWLHLQEITLFLNHGFSLEQIKQFLIAYNDGLIEKLKSGNQKEINRSVFDRMKSVLDLEQNVCQLSN